MPFQRTEQERADVVTLLMSNGGNRLAAHRETGVPLSTVTRWACEAGIEATHGFDQQGAAHPHWRGMDASVDQRHPKGHKTGRCVRCTRKRRTEWANVSGRYLRDTSDYIELCVSCHRWFDQTKRDLQFLMLGWQLGQMGNQHSTLR